jgi:hypothetical protein
MIDPHDDDMRDAFQALRAQDAETTPAFERVTRVLTGRRPRAWIPWLLVPLTAGIALAIVSRRSALRLPEADAVRRAGAWRAPTDFLMRSDMDDLLRYPMVIPDFNLRLIPHSPHPSVERDL